MAIRLIALYIVRGLKQSTQQSHARINDMATSATDILKQALELKEEERAELASRLIESLDEPVEEGVEAAWVIEIERRMADLDSGSAKTLPWDEVREKLHGRLIA